MKRLGLLAALLLVTGGLGGCIFTPGQSQPPVQPQPPAYAIPVTASNSQSTATARVRLTPGSVVNYDVLLPASVLAYPVVYFELDQNLNLSLIRHSYPYDTLASSSSPDDFATGTLGLSGLSTVAAGLGRQGISANQFCLGSCIIWPTAGASEYYVSIQNPTGSTVTVDLYAYGLNYQDTYEAAGNNTPGTAVPLYSGSPDSGAIETLGDDDYWYIAGSGPSNLTFSAVDNATPVGLALDLYDSSGTYISTYYASSTSTILVYPGDYFDVYSDNYTAGPAGTSGYNLSY